MMQASRQALNELGEAWGSLPPDALPEERFQLSSEIFRMAYELFGGEESEVIGVFYERDFPHFDPGQDSLYHFMKERLKLRRIDMLHKDRGDRRKTVSVPAEDDGSPDGQTKRQVWITAESLDTPIDEDEELTRMDVTPDKRLSEIETPLAAVHYDDAAVRFLTLAFQLPQRLTGRARTPQRLRYFRMFFTDSVADILQQGMDRRPFADHERELFRALHLGYLDYFLSEICRDVPSIAACPDKPYGELVPGRPMTDPGHPLPNDVYMTYLKTAEDYTVTSPGAITNQRREYERFLREGGLC